MAQELLRGGRYAFFRGQNRDWSVRPSFWRLTTADQEVARLRLSRFLAWIEATPGLAPIAASTDSALAVAQHYGIPTTFLDFTTDPSVAAFFACSGAEEGTDACIVCLEPEPVAHAMWAAASPEGGAEVLAFEVPNLWRLEAQHGVFVHCPWDSLDDAIRLDRIYFPPGVLAAPTAEDIYPTRKSQLEILLGQYFHREDVGEFHDLAREIGMHQIDFKVADARYEPEFFRASLSRLPSWNAAQLALWQGVPTENWRKAKELGEVELRFGGDPATARENVFAHVKDWLRDHPRARSRLVNWAPQGPAAEHVRRRVAESMLRAWDGMRTLPYADDDIAAALAECAALGVALSESQGTARQAAEQCFGPVVRVEFAATDKSYSRGFVGHPDLLEALRADFFDLVRPEFVMDARSDLEHLLRHAWTPELVFELEPFAHLFARQVIPCQVLFRPDEPVFFSPGRLLTFGCP